MVKRIVGVALILVLFSGVVSFAARAFAEEESPIYNDVKKVFHYSDDFPESQKVKKTPSRFFQDLHKMFVKPHEERQAGK